MRAQSAYITWSPVQGAVGYFVYRTVATGGPYERLNASPLAGTSYADRFLRAGPNYHYVVTSVDANGVEGNYSVEVNVDR